MNLSLVRKTALISGSSQGIGKAVAIELSLLGATCILLSRNEAALEKAIGELSCDEGQQHEYYPIDFTNLTELESLIQSITQKRDIDILINNTGGPAPGLILDAGLVEFEAAFKQHVLCNQLLTQHIVPAMKKNGFGRIIGYKL